jgi:DNA repair protein RadD
MGNMMRHRAKNVNGALYISEGRRYGLGMLEDRPYQIDATTRILAAFERERRVLFAMYTGGGKTRVAVMVLLALLSRGPALLVAHRRTLVEQAVKNLVNGGIPREKIGVIMAGHKAPTGDVLVYVASIQTLSRRRKPAVKLVIIDEAHRALAAMYEKLLDIYPDAYVLGLTATPQRLDGHPMREVFGEMVEGPEPEWLAEHGYIGKGPVFAPAPEVLAALQADLRKMRKGANGDYENKALAESVGSRILVGDVIEHWKKHAEGRTTVLFAVNVEQAQRYAAAFNAAEYRAECIHGGTKDEDRLAVLARLRSGEIKVVTTCDVLLEGWDMPEVTALVCVRPTRSVTVWVQMTGRVMRPWDVHPVVLDHAGNALRLGLPLAKRQWSLDAPPKREGNGRGDGELVCKVCPECREVCAVAATTCAGCGYMWPVTHEVEGDLVEVNGPKMCMGDGTGPCPKNALAGKWSGSGRCKSCSSRANSRTMHAAWMNRPPEERSEITRKASMARPPEQRRHAAQRAAKALIDKLSPEQKTAMAMRAARASVAAITPERRAIITKQAAAARASIPNDLRKEAARKGALALRQQMTDEDRSRVSEVLRVGRESVMSMTPDERRSMAERGWTTRRKKAAAAE